VTKHCLYEDKGKDKDEDEDERQHLKMSRVSVPRPPRRPPDVPPPAQEIVVSLSRLRGRRNEEDATTTKSYGGYAGRKGFCTVPRLWVLTATTDTDGERESASKQDDDDDMYVHTWRWNRLIVSITRAHHFEKGAASRCRDWDGLIPSIDPLN